MKNIALYLFIAAFGISCSHKTITYNDPIPKHNSIKITSAFVKEERVINVWTPPNYDQTSDSFPVLYMPDGGINEDFPHIANTISKLILGKKIPPYILVGIENTVRQRDLTGPTDVKYDLKYLPNTGGSNSFRNFMKNELFPEIDKKYRTENRKAIIGESLAGLFVIETFLMDNDMFDQYVAMDPSLWFNKQYLVENFETLSKGNYEKQKKLWFAGSSAVDISKYTKELERKLKESNNGLVWEYSDEPNEKHNTIFRATKEKAMTWALNE